MKRFIIVLISGVLFVIGCSVTSKAVQNPKKQNERTLIVKQISLNSKTVHTVANPTSTTVMVNKTNSLPKTYRPKGLVRPKVKFSFGNQKLEKALMRKTAALALEKMFKAASAQKVTLYGASGFRSYKTQAALFKKEVQQYGRKKAELAVALPGKSEHQTGLAMDITAKSVQYHTVEKFAETKEGIWVAKHAHEYGFILRYPKGKEKITKYEFEPWHFRYVGVKIATTIYKKHITLEEYYGMKGI